jgi:drug/metabolite transporter (DMT)-like permease
VSGRWIGLLLVVVSACSFGSGALFAKPVYAAGIDWLGLMAWRFALAAGLSWAWLLLRDPGLEGLRELSGRRVAVLLGLGVLYVGNSGTYFAGLETVPASLAALIVYIYPVLVAVLSIRWARRLQGRRAWAALGLASLGVAFAVGGIDATAGTPLLGLLLVLASPIIYAVWIILSARLGGERGEREHAADPPGSGSETTGAGPATAIMLSATAVIYVLAGALTDQPLSISRVPSAAWPGLIGVGVVSTAVAVQTFYAGVRRIGAARAALLSTVEPIYTITLATLLLGERLTAIQLLGGLLVIAAVVLVQLAPEPAARPLAAGAKAKGEAEA